MRPSCIIRRNCDSRSHPLTSSISTRARSSTCAPTTAAPPLLGNCRAWLWPILGYRALMSLRSDFLGALQSDEPLFNAHRKIDVPPLREAELRKSCRARPSYFPRASRPRILPPISPSVRQKNRQRIPVRCRCSRISSTTCGRRWWPAATARCGCRARPSNWAACSPRAPTPFLLQHPQSEDVLRVVLTLKLATVREDGEPTRRRAVRSEFSEEEWRLVGELADHPNRLLVTAAPDGGESYAEVAHEAIFRRWDKLRDWIAAEREFLAWRSGLEGARRAWHAAARQFEGRRASHGRGPDEGAKLACQTRRRSFCRRPGLH